MHLRIAGSWCRRGCVNGSSCNSLLYLFRVLDKPVSAFDIKVSPLQVILFWVVDLPVPAIGYTNVSISSTNFPCTLRQFPLRMPSIYSVCCHDSRYYALPGRGNHIVPAPAFSLSTLSRHFLQPRQASAAMHIHDHNGRPPSTLNFVVSALPSFPLPSFPLPSSPLPSSPLPFFPSIPIPFPSPCIFALESSLTHSNFFFHGLVRFRPRAAS